MKRKIEETVNPTIRNRAEAMFYTLDALNQRCSVTSWSTVRPSVENKIHRVQYEEAYLLMNSVFLQFQRLERTGQCGLLPNDCNNEHVRNLRLLVFGAGQRRAAARKRGSKKRTKKTTAKTRK